jgi:hypothetical protein
VSSANSKCIDLTKQERARKCDLGGCRYYQQFALLPPELRLAHHWRPGSHNRSTTQPLTSAQEDNKDTSKRAAPTREGHYFRIISKRRAQVSERWVCLAGGAAALRAVLLHGPKSSHRANSFHPPANTSHSLQHYQILSGQRNTSNFSEHDSPRGACRPKNVTCYAWRCWKVQELRLRSLLRPPHTTTIRPNHLTHRAPSTNLVNHQSRGIAIAPNTSKR